MTVRDFRKALAASTDSVFHAAKWLQKAYGCTVRISPPPVDPETKQPIFERDAGDIVVTFERVVEVKHRPSLEFTSAEDYPFNTIMVANVEPSDLHQIHMWVILNKNMTHAAVIKGKDKKHFIKENVYCWPTKKYELKYMCPKEFVQFVDINNPAS